MEDTGHLGEDSIFPPSTLPLSPKAQDFRRLANARVAHLNDTLRKIGNLSHPGNYEFSPGDVEVLFKTLQARLAEQRALFDRSLNRRRRG